MSITKMYFFLSILLILCPYLSEAQYSGTRSCELDTDIVQVVRNQTSQSIFRKETMEAQLDDLDFLLETGTFVQYDVRECRCGGARGGTYCFTEHAENYCYARTSYQGLDSTVVPMCYRRTLMYSFVQMFFAPICFALLILLASVSTTRCGKHAKNYVFSRCFPSINQRIVDNILMREAMRRAAFRRAIGMELVEDASAEDQNGTQQKLSLQLKTKTFQSMSSGSGELGVATGDNVDTVVKKDEDDESENHAEDDVFCSICLVQLEPGDRIGALPCNHSFHVECLKTWVLWRNVCPLCNVPDIASTHVTNIPQDANGN